MEEVAVGSSQPPNAKRKQKGSETDRTQIHIWGKECGGEDKDVLAPWIVAPLSGRHVNHVAAGAAMSLAVTDAGEVFTWGDGCYGQLGHGGLERQTTPRVVEGLRSIRVAHASCGGYHVLATAVCGEVYSWGLGMFGQLGHGELGNQTTPKRIDALRGTIVVETAGGHCHSLAVNDRGEVFSWGCGEDGRLGHSLHFRNYVVPTQIRALQGRRVVKVACGALHSVVLTGDGGVFTWGGGDYGLLGHGDETGHPFPTRVETLRDHRVVAVSAGHCFTIALTDGGQLYSWGLGDNGGLGHGDSMDRPLPRRVEFFAGQRVIHIASGSRHSAALTEAYELFTWGCGASGQLGHGDQSDEDSPRRVEGVAKRKALFVACGYNHVVALSDTLRGSRAAHPPPHPGILRSFSSPAMVPTVVASKAKRQWRETGNNATIAEAGQGDADSAQRIRELEATVNSLRQQLVAAHAQLQQKTQEVEQLELSLQQLQNIRNDELRQVLEHYTLETQNGGACPEGEAVPTLEEGVGALAIPDLSPALMSTSVGFSHANDVTRLHQELNQLRKHRENLEKTVNDLMMELESTRRAKRNLQTYMEGTHESMDVETQLHVEKKGLDVRFLQQLTVEQLEDLGSLQCERFRLVAHVKAEKMRAHGV